MREHRHRRQGFRRRLVDGASDEREREGDEQKDGELASVGARCSRHRGSRNHSPIFSIIRHKRQLGRGPGPDSAQGPSESSQTMFNTYSAVSALYSILVEWFSQPSTINIKIHRTTCIIQRPPGSENVRQ